MAGWGIGPWGLGPWGLGEDSVELTDVSTTATLGTLAVTGTALVLPTGVSTTGTLGSIRIRDIVAVCQFSKLDYASSILAGCSRF